MLPKSSTPWVGCTLQTTDRRICDSIYPNVTLSRSAITGSAVARHCCKARARINRKTENPTPCKIVTPENFSPKLHTRDFVVDGKHHANFGANRFGGEFSPTRRNITPLWFFWLFCPVLFYSGTRPGRTVGPIFTLYGSNDVFPLKEVPFGGYNDRWRHLWKYGPKPPKSGRE